MPLTRGKVCNNSCLHQKNSHKHDSHADGKSAYQQRVHAPFSGPIIRFGASCASRSIEALVWINETESAKSIADLKTSYTTEYHQRELQKKSLHSRRSCPKRKALFHWMGSRLGDR